MKNSILECTTYDEVLELTNHNLSEIRLEAYRLTGFNEKALKDESEDIRVEAYETLGFTKKALEDKYWLIRVKAYQKLGFTKEAFNDKCGYIRELAYRALGFTEEALQDKSALIREYATNYFHTQKLKQEYEKKIKHEQLIEERKNLIQAKEMIEFSLSKINKIIDDRVNSAEFDEIE